MIWNYIDSDSNIKNQQLGIPIKPIDAPFPSAMSQCLDINIKSMIQHQQAAYFDLLFSLCTLKLLYLQVTIGPPS